MIYQDLRGCYSVLRTRLVSGGCSEEGIRYVNKKINLFEAEEVVTF